jgi:hypothetical protein
MDPNGQCTPVGGVDVNLRSIVNSKDEVLLSVDPYGDRPLWELDDSPMIGVQAECGETSTNGTLLQFHASNLHSSDVVILEPYFTISLIHNSISKFPVSV